jgi:hypothetical protein
MEHVAFGEVFAVSDAVPPTFVGEVMLTIVRDDSVAGVPCEEVSTGEPVVVVAGAVEVRDEEEPVE